MVVISIAMSKGGIGKSEVTFHLGGALAARGLRVLFIDTDPQGTLTGYFGFDPEAPGFDAASLAALFRDPEMDAARVARLVFRDPKRLPNLALVGACEALLAYNHPVGGQRDPRELVVSELVAECRADFDVVLIDTMPNFQLLCWSALVASDFVLSPLPPEVRTYSEIIKVPKLVARVNRARPRAGRPLEWTGILLNRVKKNLIHRLFIERAEAQFGRGADPDRQTLPAAEKFVGKLLAARVAEMVALPKASGLLLPVSFHAPRSVAAQALNSVAEEVAPRWGLTLPALAPPSAAARRAAS
jgi:cellulose biosynthesis protein BcsQ